MDSGILSLPNQIPQKILQDMDNAWKAASEDLYKATQESQAAAQPGSNGQEKDAGKNEEVKDVDFEEVTDEKKEEKEEKGDKEKKTKKK